MSSLIDEKTPIIVQGFTGDKASFHASEMINYGSNVVGGVTPGKGGLIHLERPVFNTVKDAVNETNATASLAFVPPTYAADALMEAADAGLSLVCIITDGIPSQDMMRVKRFLMRYPKNKRTTVVGPNCAGIISPGKSMLGIMPGHIYKKGKIGIVSRSGTLGYEAADQLSKIGLGGACCLRASQHEELQRCSRALRPLSKRTGTRMRRSKLSASPRISTKQ